MKKLGLLVKETTEKSLKNRLKDSSSLFIINYLGVSSPDICSLRQKLTDQGASLFVAKNSVARRALRDSGFEVLCDRIAGPSGFVFVKDNPVGTSKVLSDFVKTNDKLKLEGGYLQDKILDKKDIEALAKLPSKEVLRAQVVMTLNAPIRGLVVTLNQVLKKFVYCLDQIKNKKSA